MHSHYVENKHRFTNILLFLRHICVHPLAPAVALTTSSSTEGGIVTVTEGSAISFNCDYDDIIPSGIQSVFYFNGNETIKSKVSEAEVVDISLC